MDAIRYFFDSGMLNPHGICLLWRPELLWTHVVSDALIGLAYFSIPLALGVFLYHRRREVGFGWMIWLFVAFIMLCGVTHFMSIWTLWNADYGIEALIKAFTAAVSVLTAIALWPLLPRLIAIPAPATLQARVEERDRALEDLQRAMADMVAMKEHEARQQLLLDELNHRVKNTLASVQSIASQTLRSSQTPQDFRADFDQRLMALSQTHDLLVEQQWESASLRALAEKTLSPYGRPWSMQGPDLRLHPNYAVTLGMALHELATNALKYGAWAEGSQGAVELRTIAEGGDHVSLIWRESGGAQVQEPERSGFGLRLLRRAVAAELGGSVEMRFEEGGLVYVISAPQSEKIVAVEPSER